MQRENARRRTSSSMKKSIIALAAAAALPSLVGSVHAQTLLTWDADNLVSTGPQDGAGTWDGGTNWWNGSTDVVWNNANNDYAVFGAGTPGGAVTIVGGVNVSGLDINTTGYNISGSQIHVNNNDTPVNINSTGTISSNFDGSGSARFTVAPSVTLNLGGAYSASNAPTFTGGGTVNLTNTGAYNYATSIALNGVTLRMANAVVYQGTFSISGTNTITFAGNGSLTPSSGGLSGNGTLIIGAAAGATTTLDGDNSNFTGTIGFANASILRFNGNNSGSDNAVFSLGSVGQIIERSVNATGTVKLGALFGDPGSTLAASSSAAGTVTYQIGGLAMDSVFNGVIKDTGSGSLTAVRKIGNNTLTLGNTNTYTAPTSINSGTLLLSSTGTLSGTRNIAVQNGGTFNALAAGGYTLPSNAVLTGAGGYIYGNVVSSGTINSGSASLTESGSLNFNNNLTVNAGTLAFDINGGNPDNLNIAGTLALNGGTLFVSPNGNTGAFTLLNYNTLAGSLANMNLLFASRTDGSFVQGTGTIGVNINGFSAPASLVYNSTTDGIWDVQIHTNFQNGVVTADKFFANDSVTFNDPTASTITTVTKTGNLQPSALTFANNTGTYTIAGTGSIADPGSALTVEKTGTGTVILSTANSYTGGTNLRAGTLLLANGGGIGTGGIVVYGGTFKIDQGVTYGGQTNIANDGVTLMQNGGGANQGTFSGLIADNGHTYNVNVGTGLTLNLMPATANVIGDSTGTMNFATSTGSLRFADTNAYDFSGITIDLGTASLIAQGRSGSIGVKIGALAGGPGTTLRGSAAATTNLTYTIGGNSRSTTFNGSITNGSGSATTSTLTLVKTGTGTLTLTGTSSYTGTTTISNGTLLVDGLANSGGAYTIASGANFGGNGVINSPVTVTGSLTPGDSVGTLTVGTLTMNGGSNLKIDLNRSGGDKVNVKTALTVTAPINVSVTDAGSMIAGVYPLIDYTTGTPAVGSFTLGSTPANGFTYALSLNSLATSLDLVVTGAGPTNSQWNVNADGTWGTSGNWAASMVPNGQDYIANFGSVISTSHIVTIGSSVSASKLNFDVNSAAGVAYTVTGTAGQTLTLNSSTGTGTINNISGSNSITGPLALQLTSSANVFVANATDTLTIGAAISGTGSVNKSGSGILALSGSNTYSGTTTLGAGTVGVSSSAALGSAAASNTLIGAGGALRLTGTVDSPATRTVTLNAATTIDTNANNGSIAGVISGSFGISKAGTGILSLTGNNTFTGPVTVSGGTLAANSSTALGSGASTNTLSLAVASLQALGTIASPSTRGITIPGGGTIDTNGNAVSIAGVISGTGPLGKTGPGVLTLTGTNTYVGTNNLRGGLVNVNVAANLGAAANTISFAGGGVQFATGSTLDLSTRPLIISGAGTIDTNGNNITFANAIGGASSGQLIKAGAGILTLGATSTYTGGTSVVAGTLIAPRLVGNGALAVSGGVFQLTSKALANDLSGRSVVPSLSITGGSVDLTNNALIVDYTTLGTTLTDIRGYLSSGSLTTTSAVTGYGIGYADASAIGKTTFGGAALSDNTAVIVGYVLKGDTNFDGKVNLLDFNALATSYGTGSVWSQGDFTYNGVIDTADFTTLAQNYNVSGAVPSDLPGATALGALVPEPTSLAAIATLGLLGGRRRRRA